LQVRVHGAQIGARMRHRRPNDGSDQYDGDKGERAF